MSFILEKGRKAYSGYFYCVVSITTTKALFTLGARVVVPGYRHQMVLCSDTGYPRYQHHLSALYSGTETVPEFWCGHLETRARPWCQNSIVGTWKNVVFTLGLSNNLTRAPCSGSKCELSNSPLTSMLYTF